MKTRRISRIIASFAVAGVMAFTGARAYAEEAIGTMTEPQSLEVYCPANDDSEFPFNFDIDAAPESIRFVELEEPIYGFESLLDEEALVFDVKFSLKDEYLDFDGYRFGVYNADYSEEITSGDFESGEVFTIPGLALGTGYKIDMTLESETLTAYYGGQFVIQAELDSTLAVDLFYQLADMSGDISLYNTYKSTEIEDNNSERYAEYIGSGSLMEGSLSDKYDVDYFYFYSTNDSSTGVVTLDVSLSVPKGLMIGVDIYSEDGKYSKSTLNSYNSGLYFQINNVAPNTLFYVKLSYRTGTLGGNYCLSVKRTVGYAWFGQKISNIGYLGDSWNTYKLNTLKIQGVSGKKVFFNDDVYDTSHWMREGCGLAATAMILRNMGATMMGYDFRTDFYGTLAADPFTVMLASCETDGTNMKSDDTYMETRSSGYDPSELHTLYVCDKFNVSKKAITIESVGSDEASLKAAVAKYGHVLIRFKKKSNNNPHFMVIVGFTEGSTLSDRILVCDPAAESYVTGAGENGGGVPLSKTTSGFSDLSLLNIESTRCYKIISVMF